MDLAQRVSASRSPELRCYTPTWSACTTLRAPPGVVQPGSDDVSFFSISFFYFFSFLFLLFVRFKLFNENIF
jgi:hypothetical protein